MSICRAKIGLVGGVIVVLCGLGALLLGAELWWIPTALGVYNIAVSSSIYVNARMRGRQHDA